MSTESEDGVSRRKNGRAIRGRAERLKDKLRHALLGATALTLVGLATPAAAQNIQLPVPSWPGNALEPAATEPRADTPFNRPRPDYDPLGIRVGSFLVFPSVAASATYDSNVFATSSGAQSDVFFSERPSLSIKSDWNQNAVSLNLGGDFRQYTKLTSENVNNGSAELVGRYDISVGEYFLVDALYELTHEDRTSPDAVFGKNPTEYHVSAVDFGYVRQPGRLSFRIDSTITSYSFNNSTSSTGETLVQHFRDRVEFVLAPKISYEIIPGYQAFIRGVGNERMYFSQDPDFILAPPTKVRRNSHGWEIDAGIGIELTRVIAAELYVGYLQQDYENPLLKSPGSLAFGGNLIWNATPLTSVIGSFSQSIAETTLDPASSSLETNVQLTVQHELLRNFLLLGSVAYTRDDYQGDPRKDNTYGANLGARYLLNRRWSATADLTYSQRDSNVVDGGYKRLLGTVGLKLGF